MPLLTAPLTNPPRVSLMNPPDAAGAEQRGLQQPQQVPFEALQNVGEAFAADEEVLEGAREGAAGIIADARGFTP